MKTFTVGDIRMLEPRFDPVTGLDINDDPVLQGGFVPENWAGTALDILKIEACPAEDRLWLVLREGWIDDTTLRLFAVWCARQAMLLADEHDPRSVAACDVAEQFAHGGATDQELTVARDAANVAAWDVPRDPVNWAAAWAAEEAAAEAAARAARAAAGAAVWAARAVAEVATWPAVEAAVREEQVKHLIMMLESDED